MNIENIVEFLDKAQSYLIGSVGYTQEKGSLLLHEGRLYIQTDKRNSIFEQIAFNPRVELRAFIDGKWLLIVGELVADDNCQVKAAMLEKYPDLHNTYEDNDDMQMFYFKDATAKFLSASENSEEIKL